MLLKLGTPHKQYYEKNKWMDLDEMFRIGRIWLMLQGAIWNIFWMLRVTPYRFFFYFLDLYS